MKKSINIRYVGAAVLTVVLFLVQYIFSYIGGRVSELFDFSSIDRDGLFMQVSVHHIVQMICALVLIFILNRSFGLEGFGLLPRYDKKGVRYTAVFCLVIIAYYILTYIICGLAGTITTFNYEPSGVNVAGTLGFQLLLSGPSEEILFRSLPIVLYLHVLKPEKKTGNATAIILAALLFGAAHINFREMIVPWFQVCYAFVLGLAYGAVFIRTGSVIYPMIMHSMSNVISVGGCYLYMMLS